jgi:lysophospholipase L1-like esterase
MSKNLLATLLALSSIAACVPVEDQLSAACDVRVKKVLVIGDSISQGYYPHVGSGDCDIRAYHTKGNNKYAGFALKDNNLENWLATVPDADMITFNHGQHDMYRTDPEATNPVRTTLEEYRENLHQIVDKLELTGKPFIFFTTTGFGEGTIHRRPEDVALYNEVAVEVMNERGVPVYDLNAWAAERTDLQIPANTHWTEEGYAYLAEFVTEAIRETLQ